MKKLIFILCLALASCSTDDPDYKEFQYFVNLRAECNPADGWVSEWFEVSKYDFETLERKSALPGCQDVKFDNIDGEEVFGILNDLKKTEIVSPSKQ